MDNSPHCLPIGSAINPLTDVFLYSHYSCAWFCTDGVRRNSVWVVSGTKKGLIHCFCCYQVKLSYSNFKRPEMFFCCFRCCCFFSSENSGVMWSNKAGIRYGNETYSVGRVFLQSPNGGVHDWPQKLKFCLHGVQHFALSISHLKTTPL